MVGECFTVIIISNDFNSAEASRVLTMAKHFPEFVIPPTPLDYFAPGYPSEVSQRWWKEVGEFYNNQAKGT